MTVSKPLVAILIVAGLSAGPVAGQSLSDGSRGARAGAPVPTEYRIGVEDVLDVVIWKDQDLTVKGVPVRPDGRITLPVVNDIPAVGLTPMQLRNAIKSGLETGGKYHDLEVSVTVKEVNSMHFSIVGKVRTPNRYPLRSAMTVVDAIAMSGGFADFADKKNIYVLRRDGTRQTFNYDEFVKRPMMAANFLLQPGDQIIVP